MAEFNSEVKTIPYTQEQVFALLSDLSHLEKFKDRIPQDKISDLQFSADSCSFSAPMVGTVCFSIVEKTPFDTIKFEAEKLPVGVYMFVKLNASGEQETQMRISIEAELTPFLKPMVSGHLQKLADKLADALSVIPY